MNVVAIVQARMGSSRLPGKVMLTLAGKPMIYHVTTRVRRVPNITKVVIATSISPLEEPLTDYLWHEGLPVFRGSETDVLSRYYLAAWEHSADAIVRITADCPLISPEVTEKVVAHYLENADRYDYVSNCHLRTYPRGLDTEVFSFAALERAHQEATAESDREHVTPYIWRQPERFRLSEVTGDEDRSHLRWTVDTPEDFDLVSRIYGALYPENPEFEYRDVLELLDRYPEWFEINRYVKQKRYGV